MVNSSITPHSNPEEDNVLNKNEFIDIIQLDEMSRVQIRKRCEITDNGNIIATTYHREVLEPGTDLTGQDPRVITVANAVWTPEVIQRFNEYKASLMAPVIDVTPTPEGPNNG